MLETDNTDSSATTDTTDAPPANVVPAKSPRKRAAKKAPAEPAAGEPAAPRARAAKKAPAPTLPLDVGAPAGEAAPAAAPRKRTRKAAAAPADVPAAAVFTENAAPPNRTPRKRAAKKVAPQQPDGLEAPERVEASELVEASEQVEVSALVEASALGAAPSLAAPAVLFQPPSEAPVRRRRQTRGAAVVPSEPADDEPITEPLPGDVDLTVAEAAEDEIAEPDDVREAAIEEATGARRRRRRGRRGRGGGGARATGDAEDTELADADTDDVATETGGSAGSLEDSDDADEETEAGESTATRRRRRRRRSAGGGGGEPTTDDDPPNTVVHVRPPRESAGGGDDDGVRGVKGSTRLEAKRQRRRDGRESGRRRPSILTEAEFLARREAVDRVMAVRQTGDRTQIAVLEDDVLVEHYVTRASATSYVGNIYLGRVQNVLPSMEAAFVDIGKGRNGVLYAGEVNWDAAGLEGKSRNIEHALKSGDVVLVQVTKDPIGHKGARLTSQISLPGRFLVYVPGGGMTGISRKLPDTERTRLKAILKKIVPEEAGVIIRTAAEGASEEDITRDVDRLKAQWEIISAKTAKTSAAPTLVHGEPDLAIRVVRDVFNEDFKQLIVQGEDAWKTVTDYVEGVAPDLAERVSRHTAETDLFHNLRVDEQLMKALDRKVWLPSGGSLVIDRTEAMTVIDVNTGKFIGSGGNLEQTVTRNNIEAAEEIVRQLRLRDVGGIVVIDFIDMVLESNRDLVLRRLTECLGRDRTKHQVAEVTSLGLVQMTRKRVGEGLLEAFSETCEHCNGRGVLIHSEPVDLPSSSDGDDDDRPKSKRRRGSSKKAEEPIELEPPMNAEQRRAALAAMAAIHRAAHPEDEAGALKIEADEGVESVPAEVVDAALDAERERTNAQETNREVEVETISSDVDSVPSPEASEDESGHVAESAEVAEQIAAEQVAAEQVAADQVAADQVAAEPVVVPEPVALTESEKAAGAAAEAAYAAAADEVEPEHSANGAPARRRRRAASRPAGPPVAINS